MKQVDPLSRFSSRAALYQNRPHYPHSLLNTLRESCGLTSEQVIADIGSGTGYLTGLFIENGNRVYAVEPNEAMRTIAEKEFRRNSNFISVNGQAEEIPLCDHVVDMVTIGQALHWFEIKAARSEFLRILRPGGWIVVVDNRTVDTASDLMLACADLRRRDFTSIGTADDPPERIVKLFDGMEYKTVSLPNLFRCDEQTFKNGFLSSSLAPQPGSRKYQKCEKELGALFGRFQLEGKVTLDFITMVWSGSKK